MTQSTILNFPFRVEWAHRPLNIECTFWRESGDRSSPPVCGIEDLKAFEYSGTIYYESDFSQSEFDRLFDKAKELGNEALG